MNDTSDEEELKAIDKERRLKRKQSLEASVTAGCGYGKKKQRIVEAFYSTVWPLLSTAGWEMVSLTFTQ